MLSNVIIPANVAIVVIVVVLLALLFVPRLAEAAWRFFGKVRDKLLGFAGGLGILIKRIWGRDDFLVRRQEVLDEVAREEVAKRRKAKGDDLLTEAELEAVKNSVNQTYNVTGAPISTDTSSRLAKANNWWRQARVNRAIRAEVQRQREQRTKLPLSEDELAEVQEVVRQTYGGQEPEVSGSLIVQGWVRRIIYLLLALVCVGADYVLVSTRAPILFGGGETPPFLKALFSYLQIITGVLFVSAAALSGMLIQEHTKGLSPIVKIEPDIGPTEKAFKLGLAIAMIVIDAIVVIFLTVGGVFQEFLQTQDLEVIYVVFVGTSILIAIGIFLAFTGLYQAIQGLAVLVVGAILGLPSILLGFVCGLIVAFLAFLDRINRAIYGRKKQLRIIVPEELRNLTVIGFGTWGSAMAVRICREAANIYGSFVWLAGVYAPPQVGASSNDPAESDATPDGRLKATEVAAHYVSVSPTSRPKPAADSLVNALKARYANTDADKPLLWIVDGLELEPCLDALKQLGTSKSVKGLRLALVWRVPQSITRKHRELAGKLWTWAVEAESALATTVVIEAASPLVEQLNRQEDPVLARSFASLLATDQSNRNSSFTTMISQLHDAGFPFSALQAGSVGIIASPDAFRTQHGGGFILGMAGEINPRLAAGSTQTIAEAAFEGQILSTVTDEWPKRKDAHTDEDRDEWERLQNEVFVNIIVPSKLRREDLLNAYKDDTSKILAEEYGVPANQVTYTALRDETDKGIPTGGVDPVYGGDDYYIHFTTLRGVGPGNGAVPERLEPIITEAEKNGRGNGAEAAPVSPSGVTDAGQIRAYPPSH